MIMNDESPVLASLAARLVDGSVCISAEESPPAGVVVGLLTGDDDDAQVASAGIRSLDGAPMEPTTRHDLASVTKLFTTTAVMRLVSEGHLDLDAPVDRWLPMPAPVPTLRQLMRHRGGLLPWQPLYLQATGRSAVLDLIASLPRREAPDVSRSYSDLGFILLGMIIEEITGEDLPAALAKLIINPLGLTVGFGPEEANTAATSAHDNGVEQTMIATGDPYPVLSGNSFDRWRPGPISGEVNDGNAHYALGGVAGHAGLFATVPDLLRLGQAVADPSPDLWTPEVLSEFTTAGPDPQQGLGFWLWELSDGRQLIWHPGFTGTGLGIVRGPAPTVVALASNRLLGHGRPVPTDRLWQPLLQGVGLVPTPEPHQEGTR